MFSGGGFSSEAFSGGSEGSPAGSPPVVDLVAANCTQPNTCTTGSAGINNPVLNLVAASCSQPNVSSAGAITLSSVTITLVAANSTQANTCAAVAISVHLPGEVPTMPSPGYIITECLRAGLRTTTQGDGPVFSDKDPEEVVALGWDFAVLTLSAGNPSVSIVRHAGAADDDPSAMLAGACVIVGTQLLQRVAAGIDQAQYAVRFEIDDADGNHYAREGVLPVRVK